MTATAATLGPTAYWYLTRATGFVALVLLTAILVLGVMGPMRVTAPRWPRFAIDSLHRDLSLLAIALIVVHVLTTVLDGFAPIGLIDGLIPFHSPYRPLWLGFGALAFDLMLALVITSLVRRRLGYRSWRAIHWLAYASWPIAVLHGLGTGSDSKQAWGLLLTFACVVAVSAAAIGRVARTELIGERMRAGSIGTAVVVPIALIAFTLLGPLAPHWAQRAGTPAKLLASAHTPRFVSASRATGPRSSGSSQRPTTPAATPKKASLKLPFMAQMSGSVRQTAAPGGAILDMELRLSGGIKGDLRIRLAGQPIGGEGLSLVGSQVDLVAAGLPAALQGKVTSLEGSRLTARVSGGTLPPVDLQAELQVDTQADRVTGTLIGRTVHG